MFSNSVVKCLLEDCSSNEKVKWIIEIQFLSILMHYNKVGGSRELDTQIEEYTRAYPMITKNATELFKNLKNHIIESYLNKFADPSAIFLKAFLIKVVSYLLATQLNIKNKDVFSLFNRQLLTNQISISEYTKFFVNDLGLEVEKTIGRVQTITMAYNRLKNYCNGILSNTYYFEYVQPKKNCCGFCSNNSGSYFTAAEILTLPAEHLKPIVAFGGKPDCTGLWEPDPFYKKSFA